MDHFTGHGVRNPGCGIALYLSDDGSMKNVTVEAAVQIGDSKLQTGGELNDKFPGGTAAQRARLEAEDFDVIARGKRLFVANYAHFLFGP